MCKYLSCRQNIKQKRRHTTRAKLRQCKNAWHFYRINYETKSHSEARTLQSPKRYALFWIQSPHSLMPEAKQVTWTLGVPNWCGGSPHGQSVTQNTAHKTPQPFVTCTVQNLHQKIRTSSCLPLSKNQCALNHEQRYVTPAQEGSNNEIHAGSR